MNGATSLSYKAHSRPLGQLSLPCAQSPLTQSSIGMPAFSTPFLPNPTLHVLQPAPPSPQPLHRVTSPAEPIPLSPKTRTGVALAFHGLPPEILRHIAMFLPFHDLIKVYKCLPKGYQPNFQQPLDHSLALMVLTLEIRQDLMEPMGSPLATPAVLQSRWRIINFDMERMKVEFELEEKLGLRMAQERVREIRTIASATTAASSSPPTVFFRMLPAGNLHALHHAAMSLEEDIERVIWECRRRAALANLRTTHEVSSTNLQCLDFWDSNFFHCTRPSPPPVLASARISFKAHRNMPAPWIVQQACLPGPRHSMLSSPVTQSSGKGFIAFYQDRMLQRSLSEMKNHEESSNVQFLPEAIELDARELGQRKTGGVSRRTVQLGQVRDEPRQSWLSTVLQQLVGGSIDWISAISSVLASTTMPYSCSENQNRPAALDNADCQDVSRDDEDQCQLFEFTYDVRHNYLSSRLEGERVIRPIRFACSLDFFVLDS